MIAARNALACLFMRHGARYPQPQRKPTRQVFRALVAGETVRLGDERWSESRDHWVPVDVYHLRATGTGDYRRPVRRRDLAAD